MRLHSQRYIETRLHVESRQLLCGLLLGSCRAIPCILKGAAQWIQHTERH